MSEDPVKTTCPFTAVRFCSLYLLISSSFSIRHCSMTTHSKQLFWKSFKFVESFLTVVTPAESGGDNGKSFSVPVRKGDLYLDQSICRIAKLLQGCESARLAASLHGQVQLQLGFSAGGADNELGVPVQTEL